MRSTKLITHRFPAYGWAWPSGDLDTLLKAILLPDREAALSLALAWLSRNEIDSASSRDHRLLAALADRFGGRLADNPAYPRLVGLQKQLWSRSRLALAECRETLSTLTQAGIPLLLIKGAARIAADPSAVRGRAAHDIDIVVPMQNMGVAADTLLRAGWQAFNGAGSRRIRADILATRSVNFFRGNAGDIDLHSSAYHALQASSSDDALLWKRSVASRLFGVQARIPSPADRVAISIAHGGLGAHAHSDWLVDIEHVVRQGGIDWAQLLATLSDRRLLVTATSVLSYLKLELNAAIPDDILRDLTGRADLTGWRGRLALLEAKPRSDFGWLSGAARGVLKQARLLRERNLRSTNSATWWAWRSRACRPAALYADVARIAVPPEYQGKGAPSVEIVVSVEMPAVARRIEIELGTEMRHLARLRYLKMKGVEGTRQLTFRGVVRMVPGESALLLEARPSRNFRVWRTNQKLRYGALPFAVVKASFRNGPA